MPGLRIYNNIYSLNSQRHLGNATQMLGGTLEKLSSGMRVNRGSDDAAALAISEGLRSDIVSYNQAVRNTSDGISVINVTEGALNEQSHLLTRMRELSIEAANFSISSGQRATINIEFSQLKDEIDRISLVTNFNGQFVLNGSLSSASPTAATNPMLIQVDIHNDNASMINLNTALNLTSMDVTALNVSTTDVLTSSAATSSLQFIDSAIQIVTAGRGRLGAIQNRLERTISNLEIAVENVTAADSRIRDADMAKEISKLTRNQILVQSGTSMLAQANQIPQSVLKLLG